MDCSLQSYLSQRRHSQWLGWSYHRQSFQRKTESLDCYHITSTVVTLKLRKLHIKSSSDQGWNTAQVSGTPFYQENINELESAQRRARLISEDQRCKSGISSMFADLNWSTRFLQGPPNPVWPNRWLTDPERNSIEPRLILDESELFSRLEDGEVSHRGPFAVPSGILPIGSFRRHREVKAGEVWSFYVPLWTILFCRINSKFKQ